MDFFTAPETVRTCGSFGQTAIFGPCTLSWDISEQQWHHSTVILLAFMSTINILLLLDGSLVQLKKFIYEWLLQHHV